LLFLVFAGTGFPPTGEASEDHEFSEWDGSEDQTSGSCDDQKEEWPGDSLDEVSDDEHFGGLLEVFSDFHLLIRHEGLDDVEEEHEHWEPGDDDHNQEDQGQGSKFSTVKSCKIIIEPECVVQLIQVEHVDHSEDVEPAWHWAAATTSDISLVVLLVTSSLDHNDGVGGHWLLLNHAWLLHHYWLLLLLHLLIGHFQIDFLF